ncbi:hypothetical protein SUSAZ_08615 [Sulfolobus acidocaldarius SUSAZ]|nr:hypothetical protein SUSAZ_08615 [Sulfolobus acidocaldarius SUSAZ]
MSFNGIGFYTDKPGEISLPIVAAYFVIALAVVIYFGKRTGGLKAFKTIDWVYIGIGAAAAYIWQFIIGAVAGGAIPSGLTNFIQIPFWGRIFIIFIVAGLVRKVGVGMISLFLFDLLSSLFHYGFSGEPMFFIYEALTYGLFIDLMIAFTGGKIFGLGLTKGPTYVNAISALEGAILGVLWAIPYYILYFGFFNPFINGAVVSWSKIIFGLATNIPIDGAVGIFAELAANSVGNAVQV